MMCIVLVSALPKFKESQEGHFGEITQRRFNIPGLLDVLQRSRALQDNGRARDSVCVREGGLMRV